MGFRMGNREEMGAKVMVMRFQMGVVEVKGEMWLRNGRSGFGKGLSMGEGQEGWA